MGVVSLIGRSSAPLCAAALGVAALFALAACDEQTVPTAPPPQEPPPARAPADLMGAPDRPPPPMEAPPPPPFTPRTMAPIPNPGEPGSEGYYTAAPRLGSRRHDRFIMDGGVVPATPEPQDTAAYARPRSRDASGAAGLAAPGLAAGAAIATAPHRRIDAANRPAAPAAAPARVLTQADHINALQTRLAADLAKAAILTGPAKATGAGPGAGDVSLKVPASFLDQIKAEAAAEGLGEAAASADLIAQLSGSGYSVLPAEAQSQPLASGRDTVFHWVATPVQGPKGPLTAHVKATLLGGGAIPLDLGTVSGASASDRTGPHILGAALLLLAGVLATALMFRWRRPSEGSAFTRAPPAPGRPLDLTAPASPEPRAPPPAPPPPQGKTD